MHVEVLDARRAGLMVSSLMVSGLVSGLGVTLFAAPAHADVKIVTDVTVTRQSTEGGDAGVPATQTVTTYYKGRYARVEVAGGPVTLYNDDAGRVYTLDPAAKTYYVLPLKQVQEGQAGTDSGNSNLDVKLDLKSPDGAETRSYVGLTAKEYNVTGSISPAPREARSGGPLGGIFGGGGFPGGGGSFPGGGGGGHRGRRGGGGGGQRGGQGGQQAARTEISGEVWLSDAAKLPDDKKATALPSARLLFPGGGPALKPLTDALNKTKLLPLYSRITETRAARRARGANQADGGQPASASPERTETTATQVTAFSQVPLDDALFHLPSGYTQVDPPLTSHE